MTDVSVIPVLCCTDLDEMVDFLVGLGARVDSIAPADTPGEVFLSFDGSSICARRTDEAVTSHLIVRRAGESFTVQAPNGAMLEFRSDTAELVIPPSVPSLSVVTGGGDSGGDFGVGRAGMEYRDLLPDRWGGRFIASHIRIADGGDVPDSVHYHRIRFQMIFCARGWVDLVYEDQGESFRLHAGDCVLQPPEIRHRVLRSSPGLEVIEIGCPAVHDTMYEHEIALPTAACRPDRDFGGQRFVRHVAAEATRVASAVDGLELRDTGIATATDGLAGAVVVGAAMPVDESSCVLTHDAEFVLVVGLDGNALITIDVGAGDERSVSIAARDAIALPPGARWRWSCWDADFEFLQVSLGADAVTPFGSVDAFSD